jgi:hypothetical protein
MPQLSSSNRSQLVAKLEGTYPTNFGVPQGGNGFNLNMTGESLDYGIKTESSKQIVNTRQTLDNVQVSASAQGGFNFEAQFAEYDPFIQATLQQDYTYYGTNGVSASIATLTLAAGTITAGAAPTGNDAFTTLHKGQWFTVNPPAGATQAVKDYFDGRAFRVSTTTAPTSTVITLDAATQINTAVAGTSMSNGQICSARAYNGTTMKSYTLEVQHSDISVFRQYTGMICSKMDLKLSVGQILTGSFEFMGKSMSLLGATSMGTPSASQTYTPANATKGIFDIFEGGTSISATTYIKSAELSIDNSLRAQEAVGVFGNAGVAAGTLKVMGKLEVYFADAVMYGKLISGAASSMSIPVLDVNGNGYVYYFPRIKYSAAKVNATGLDTDNMLSMDFEALMDVDPTSATYQKTVAIYRCGV